MSKGGIFMQMKGFAISLGIGAAAGAVALAMLPRQSAPRRLVDKAAMKVEDAAWKMGDKLNQAMDHM
jgi:hypothetical protein